MKRGKQKVAIVGAGPGDPDLISVKGLKILREADCILYDFLASAVLLQYAKKSAMTICVGKADGLHLQEQGEINRMLYEQSLRHDRVVRLKGGDPFVFGRGAEEARYLMRRGVEVEVVPGITSAIAGPESFGIPLTVKNRISSFAVVAGRKGDRNAAIDAPDCGTLVYVMAVRNIANIVRALRKSGRPKSMPCAFIERGTAKDARLVRATIGTIEREAKKQNVRPPAVLVVGEVVRIRQRRGKNCHGSD